MIRRQLVRLARLTGSPVLLVAPDGTIVETAGAEDLDLPVRIGRTADLARMLSSGSPIPALWEIGGERWRVRGSRFNHDDPTLIVRLERPEAEGFDRLNRQLTELQRQHRDLDASHRRARLAEQRALDLAERYRSLVLNIPSPVARFDVALLVTEINPAFASLVGSSALVAVDVLADVLCSDSRVHAICDINSGDCHVFARGFHSHEPRTVPRRNSTVSAIV